MSDTPKGLRTHIAIMGRRNAGKSSLLNALARQQAAIVSDTPGTTTDPVEKTMELAPLGPVVLIDTAGIDDEGELGSLRVDSANAILLRADLAILVTDGERWEAPEQELAQSLIKTGIPWLVVRNKLDTGPFCSEVPVSAPVIDISSKTGAGLPELVASLAKLADADSVNKKLLSDLVAPGEVALLVAPIDSGAPKGRLILPQMQAIRDCLDNRAICLVTTDAAFEQALQSLAQPPALVICDSQVVAQVAAKTPAHIPLTTFSILMARFKGDLVAFAEGAAALEALRPGDVVTIQEACSHHAQKDDIGTVKIPRLLRKLAGGELKILHRQGKGICSYDADTKVIVHCGACVITRRQMLVRQAQAGQTPMTNYGMTISLCQGILPRALALFPDALAAYQAKRLCS